MRLVNNVVMHRLSLKSWHVCVNVIWRKRCAACLPLKSWHVTIHMLAGVIDACLSVQQAMERWMREAPCAADTLGTMWECDATVYYI